MVKDRSSGHPTKHPCVQDEQSIKQLCFVSQKISLAHKKKKRNVLVDHHAFQRLHKDECKQGRGVEAATEWSHQGFRALFGIWDCEAAFLWNNLDDEDAKRTHDIVGWRPKHLLDALFFVKGCCTERQAAAFCGRDEKSLRKWNWKIADAVAGLEWVSNCTVCHR